MDTPAPVPSQPKRPIANPFFADVCTTPFEVVTDLTVSALNDDIVRSVASAVEDLGEAEAAQHTGTPLLLLTAPRAGYGKTHLLGRVAAAADTQAVAMPLVFRSDSELSWSATSLEALGILRQLPGHTPSWTRLREVCAGILAGFMQRLIQDGRVPCANPEQAIRVLSGAPSELFQEGSAARLIGEWLRKHFGQLRKPLAAAASELPGAGQMEGWIDALFAYANHGTAAAADTVVSLATGSRAAFVLWLRLVTVWRPAVVMVDHLDGFYRHEQAGLRIATMLLELADLEGVHVVLSLNQDVWQATFAHHLPSAVEDRLTASQFLLRGLTPGDAEELVRLRLRHSGCDYEAPAFLAFLDLPRHFNGRPVGSVSARAFLRHAAQQWATYQRTGGKPPAAAETQAEAKPEPAAEAPSAESLAPVPITAPVPALALVEDAAEPQSADPASDVEAESPTAPSQVNAEDSPLAAEPEDQLEPEDDEPSGTQLFSQATADQLKRTAESLTEPRPAMVDTPFSLVPSLAAAGATAAAMASPFSVAPTSITSKVQLPPRAPSLPSPPAPESQPQAPGAMERLREMVERLRATTNGNENGSAPNPATSRVPLPPASEPATPPPPAPTASDRLAAVVTPPSQGPRGNPAVIALQERFESLRQQMGREANLRPLDHSKLGELIRLAGKRFPLVRQDEIELPGLVGRSVLRWTVQSLEILFGLGDLSEVSYWRAVSQHAAARAMELQAQPLKPGEAAPQLKLVSFKSDLETLGWTSLLASEVFPTALRPHIEALHLDIRSIASLYAMHRLIGEAETGALTATPSQVMSVLARELDFFWKRVTRPI